MCSATNNLRSAAECRPKVLKHRESRDVFVTYFECIVLSVRRSVAFVCPAGKLLNFARTWPRTWSIKIYIFILPLCEVRVASCDFLQVSYLVRLLTSFWPSSGPSSCEMFQNSIFQCPFVHPIYFWTQNVHSVYLWAQNVHPILWDSDCSPCLFVGSECSPCLFVGSECSFYLFNLVSECSPCLFMGSECSFYFCGAQNVQPVYLWAQNVHSIYSFWAQNVHPVYLWAQNVHSIYSVWAQNVHPVYL